MPESKDPYCADARHCCANLFEDVDLFAEVDITIFPFRVLPLD